MAFRPLRLATFAVLALGVAACDEAPEPTTANAVTTETTEALATAQAYAYDKKKEFMAWADDQMARLDERIDQFDDGADEWTVAARGEWAEAQPRLAARREEAGRRIASARDAGAAAWTEAKAAVAEAIADRRAAYESARAAVGN